MVKLEENYRSTENILQLANRLIENNTDASINSQTDSWRRGTLFIVTAPTMRLPKPNLWCSKFAQHTNAELCIGT
jgi:hypothetical protein